MNARTVVLPNEDAHEYASLLDSYIQDILPSPVEMDLSNVEDSTTALLVRPEARVPMLLAANVNAKWRQRHETVYTRALNTLLRLRHLLESNPGAANKDSEKRTESQERTLSVYLSSQTQHEQITTRTAATHTDYLAKKFRSRRGALVIFSDLQFQVDRWRVPRTRRRVEESRVLRTEDNSQ